MFLIPDWILYLAISGTMLSIIAINVFKLLIPAQYYFPVIILLMFILVGTSYAAGYSNMHQHYEKEKMETQVKIANLEQQSAQVTTNDVVKEVVKEKVVEKKVYVLKRMNQQVITKKTDNGCTITNAAIAMIDAAALNKVPKDGDHYNENIKKNISTSISNHVRLYNNSNYTKVSTASTILSRESSYIGNFEQGSNIFNQRRSKPEYQIEHANRFNFNQLRTLSSTG